MLNLNISVSETLKQIYASSALHCYVNANKAVKPAMLTPDRKAALHLLVRDAFSFVIVDMLPCVASTSTSIDDKDEILSVNLDLKIQKGEGMLVAKLVESAIAFYTLHLVYVGEDNSLSGEYEKRAEDCMRKLLEYTRNSKLDNISNVKPYFL